MTINPGTIQATNDVATEAKQDDIITALGEVNIISSDNSYSTATLAAAAEFQGTGVDVTGYKVAQVAVRSDNATDGTLYMEVSHDGVTWGGPPRTWSDTRFAQPHMWEFVEKYFRIKYVNGSTEATNFSIQTRFSRNGDILLGHQLDETLLDETEAIITRSVSVGQNPNDTYKNSPTGGIHTANTTSTPLGVAGVWRGTWFEWSSGYIGVQSGVESNVDGTFYIDFSNTASPVDGDDTSVEDSLVITYDASETPLLRRMTPTQSRWVRFRYINGAVGQTTFDITNVMLTTATPLVMQQLDSLPTGNNLAGLVRAVIAGADANGNYVNIETTTDGALLTSSDSSLINFKYDAVDLTEVDSVTERWDYFQGGLAGTRVAFITNVYQDSSKLVLISSERTNV